MKLYLQVEICRIDRNGKTQFLPVQAQVTESIMRWENGMTLGKDENIYLKVS